MIRRLVAALGRRSFPVRDYGPWEFGRHVTVYLGRRWSWRGTKRSWTSPEGVKRNWYSQLPAQVYARWSKRERGLWVVKIEVGTLLICWDRLPWTTEAERWVADDPAVDRPLWRGRVSS